MLSAPAPNSNAGSGSHSPLRTKPPTVVRYESGRRAVGAVGSHRRDAVPVRAAVSRSCSGLILVTPSSAENWKPAKPSVSAGVIRRGAIAKPSSDIRLRKRDCAVGVAATSRR